MTYNVLMGALNPTHSLTLGHGHCAAIITTTNMLVMLVMLV